MNSGFSRAILCTVLVLNRLFPAVTLAADAEKAKEASPLGRIRLRIVDDAFTKEGRYALYAAREHQLDEWEMELNCRNAENPKLSHDIGEQLVKLEKFRQDMKERGPEGMDYAWWEEWVSCIFGAQG